MTKEETPWYHSYSAPQNNVIDPSATFGKNVKIGHFCFIDKDVIIGDNAVIEHYVLLKAGTIIGDDCFVDSYVRSSGDNKIGNNVTLRYGSTIARKVEIEDDVFISPNVMTVFSKHTGEKSEKTLIKKGAFIGTAAVIGPNITIEEGTVIGANSYVSGNCKVKNGIYVGVPAKFLKMK